MYALISFELQTKELKWAVDQESRALGHTIQSFAEHNEFRYFELDTDSTIKHKPEFEIILKRILTQDRMLQIQITNSEHDSILTLSTPDYPFSVHDEADSELLYESDFEGTHYTLIRYPDHAVINIHTELTTDFGQVHLRMVKDAALYSLKIRELRQWIGIEILISLILGIMVSIILTYFLKRRITKLTEGSRYFLQGNEHVRLDQGTISEFNDLGSTLSILVNVFHKNMDWYRKSIQQKEQERTSIQLSQFLKNSNSIPVEVSASGVRVLAALAGNDKHNFFLAKTAQEDTQLLWGSIQDSDPIEAALLSEAISEFITTCSDDDSAKSVSTIFSKQIIEINQLQITSPETIHITRITGSDEKVEVMNVATDKVLWVHSLGDSITEKVDMYTQHGQNLSHDQLFTDIRTLIGHIGSTVIIGVRRD